MKQMVEYKIYFGRNIGQDRQVSREAFGQFQLTKITPRFAGYTVLDGIGIWQDTQENMFLVVILADADEVSKIEEICQEYKELYKQECVLYTKQTVESVFA